jgi:hypothetical protein
VRLCELGFQLVGVDDVTVHHAGCSSVICLDTRLVFDMLMSSTASVPYLCFHTTHVSTSYHGMLHQALGQFTCFAMYAAVGAVSFLFILLSVAETKGRTPQQIRDALRDPSLRNPCAKSAKCAEENERRGEDDTLRRRGEGESSNSSSNASGRYGTGTGTSSINNGTVSAV